MNKKDSFNKKYLLAILFGLLLLTSIVTGLYEKQVQSLALNLNGEDLGLVKNEKIIEDAIDRANKAIQENNPNVYYKPNFSATKTYGAYKSLLSEKDLADLIMEKSDLYTNAWIVTIDGESVAALYDRDEVLDAISSFKQSFVGESKRIIKSIDFMSNVSINFGEIDTSLLMDQNEFYEFLTSSISETKVFHYKADNLSAYKDYEDLYVKRDPKSFDVFIKDQVEEKISLPASTIFIYDETLNMGETFVEREGEDGVLLRKSENEYINNNIIKSNVLNEKLISYPTSTIVHVGDRALTLKPEFQMPTFGVITSGYGPRFDGFHRGIDIAGPFGSDIKAAAPGKVTFAGYMGSYGYVVFVEHTNGYETRYAHMLRINAYKGQSVNTGDVLGEMGSSGNSTGAHCHFEILKDGDLLDPETQL